MPKDQSTGQYCFNESYEYALLADFSMKVFCKRSDFEEMRVGQVEKAESQ
ncbi:hypothetical protein [Candidatus Nitrospira salsa]|nr:MAG: hypothetical protein NPIRA01_35280 [Nitrospirales bacterium]